MALMVSLNESVRTLAGRFDTFQRTVDEKLTRFSNEQLLMKSKVEFLEKNCLPKADTSHLLVNDSYKENTNRYYNALATNGYNLNGSTLTATNVFEKHSAASVSNVPAVTTDDTEEYLKRVSSRFDEAKKMMQDANLFYNR